MTQGTKIGLLISLAFLIVVFVLLSDHAVNSNDVRPAAGVIGAAPTVAKGLTVPGAAAADASSAPLHVQAPVAPVEPVPTVQEMAQTPSLVGRTTVEFGPGPAAQMNLNAANNVPTQIRASTEADQIAPGASRLVLGELPPAVRSEVVPVARIGQMATVVQQPAPARHQQEYKAMPGDTVSRIARKYYGSESKPNCDLIVAANPSLKANPNKIVVGKTYIVPMKQPPTAAVTSPAPATPAAAMMVPVVSDSQTPGTPAGQPTPAVATPAGPSTRPTATIASTPAPTPATPAVATKEYVVKSGDSLWKIASTQCKDLNAVSKIRSMNRDVLKRGDALTVGMKLRLPN